MYIARLFMLLFVFTPEHGASERHTSHMDNGNIRIELHFTKPLPDAITCLLYLEYDNCIRIDYSRNVSSNFWWTLQILCTLQNVKSFLDVFPSDLLPHSITRSGSIIVNTDPHTERFTLASNSFRTQVLQRLLFRLLRYLPHYSCHPKFLETQLHRLEPQHGTTAGFNQHILRPILLPIRPVNEQRLHSETIHRLFDFWYCRPASWRNLHIWIRTSTQRTAWWLMQLHLWKVRHY